MTANRTVIGWVWNSAAFGLTLVCAAAIEAASISLQDASGKGPLPSILSGITGDETDTGQGLASLTPSPIAWIEAAFVLIVILLAACVAPVRMAGPRSLKPGLDIVTAAVCGLICAKILLEFPAMPWADMWVWGSVALLLALLALVWRFKRAGPGQT